MTPPMPPSRPSTARIAPFSPAAWPAYRALRLAALLESPDAFGSTHAAEAARPDQRWQSALEAAERSGLGLPLAAWVDAQQAVGLCWAQRDAQDATTVQLYQVWVAPPHRGQGLGRSLVENAIGWARGHGARWLRLGVTIEDSAAWRLYARLGFVAVGPPAPLRPGSARLAQDMVLDLARCSPGMAGRA